MADVLYICDICSRARATKLLEFESGARVWSCKKCYGQVDTRMPVLDD